MTTEQILRKEIEHGSKSYVRMDYLVYGFNKKYIQADEWLYKQFCGIWTMLENTEGIKSKKRLFKALKKFLPQDIKEFLASKADDEGYLTLYRGTGYESTNKYETDYACCYSFNAEKAEWFANRFLCIHKIGFVFKRKVHISQVVAYFNSREEEEIIIIPNNGDVLKVVKTLEYKKDN